MLKVIAIETYDVSKDTNAKSIYKTLQQNTKYFFYKGYDIQDGKIIKPKDGTFDPYNVDLKLGEPRIEVCAIVGENGSGKSSLIELMIRVINNFACYVIGECRLNASAEHLHYIKNVRAKLYFILGDEDCSLCVDNDLINLTIGGKEPIKEGKVEMNGIIQGVDENKLDALPTNFDKAYELLNQFFYTIVNNFSLYAYNSKDFAGENTADNKAQKIFDSAKDIYNWSDDSKLEEQHKNWLTGIFYKNDGYMTPIVLSPMRVEGNISVNSENEFAEDRQLSLLLRQNPKTKLYPFRTINKDKEIRRIRLSLPTAQLKDYSVAERAILEATKELFKLTYSSDDSCNKAAEQYLVAKSLKMIQNYNEYKNIAGELLSDSIDKDRAKSIAKAYVQSLFDNPSHITRKWRQTLAFLILQHYKPSKELEETIDNQQLKTSSINIQKLEETINNHLSSEKLITLEQGKGAWQKEDLLPPSIFNPKLEIFEKNEKIEFNTLSSGERQLIYFVNSIVYHLINVSSTHNDGNPRVKYKNVLVVLEEIELYFHPDLQRQLVKMLIDAIRSAGLNLESVQLMFVTHSPFVLSDIPKNNCLFLERGGKPSTNSMHTFGANIHDILNSSFFFENKGASGEFATDFINSLIAKINLLYAKITYAEQPVILEAFEKQYSDVTVKKGDLTIKDLEALEKQVAIIEEPFIQSELEILLQKIKQHVETGKNIKR